MLTLTLYTLISFALGAMCWALHLGPQSQVIVLLIGLIVFPVQKFIHRASIRDLGFRLCTFRQAGKALLLPLAILASVGIADLVSGAAQLRPLTELHNPFSNSPVSSLWGLGSFLLINGSILFLLEFVTEELMFRGYILGKLVAFGELKGLVLASLLFGLWHLPIAIWGTGLNPIRTPLYLLNMALLGTVLGLLFLESKSLIPVAAFHAVWNTLEYNLFGFMDQQALMLGSSRVAFDPEEGFIGTIALAVVALSMVAKRYWKRSLEESPAILSSGGGRAMMT